MNDVAGVKFADMSVNSTYYDLESLSTSCMAGYSFQYEAMRLIYVVWQANLRTLKH